MTVLYTLGEWTVKPGREEEFVAAWHDLAEWTIDHVEGGAWGKLLRDREAPRRFISFGPWRDDEAVEAWRAHEGFRSRVAQIRALVDSFVPHEMDVAADVGPGTPDPTPRSVEAR